MVWMVVMGVAGCGKSSVGQAASQLTGLPLIEGDDFHPPENVAKMRTGIALTDADRAGWLDRLGQEMAAAKDGAVLTCSALKRAYRERLRAAVPDLKFVFLDIDRESAYQRVASRGDRHMFPPALVDSQFAVLESPIGEPGVLRVSALDRPESQIAQIRAWRERGFA